MASESNTKLLQELEELSQSLYQSHIKATRRTASLALPRDSAPAIPTADETDKATNEDSKSISRPRRMSLSPWRYRPKEEESRQNEEKKKELEKEIKLFDNEDKSSMEKKGIWKWKPMKALSRIGMQRLSCLFSVEVIAAQGLPLSMNGLRLSVCVRKKETKDGAVHTMPSRVSQGGADFEETLFVKCNVHFSQANEKQPVKFEPRPFLIYLFAVDASELDFGRSSVDLSRLIQESLEKNAKGSRIRQWDTSFELSGKAKGGQLLLKLAFQIMDKDGGAKGLFGQFESGKAKASSSTFGRKQSKSSFSIPSPLLSSKSEVWTPPQSGTTSDFQGIDHLNLDEPPAPVTEEESKGVEEADFPDFEVVDKGVENIQSFEENSEGEVLTDKAEDTSSRSEVVKEVVQDQVYLYRLTELDSIAQQIKALESMMGDEKTDQTIEDIETDKLDADEETVTMEFLHKLEYEEAAEASDDEFHYKMPSYDFESTEETDDSELKVYLPDLGKGLGSIVQTRNGGFLAATNPLNVEVPKTDTPKLAMQISKPFVLTSNKSVSGFELFQRMAAIGAEQLSSEVLSLMHIEELMGKTAEQVAFEGIASIIISGRKKEGASSSAARTLSTVKKIANAMRTGRKERISTGLWNVGEDPITADELLAFSMQKIEAMAIDALKIQANMAEEDAPFDVYPLGGKGGLKDQDNPLASAIPLEDWIKNNELKENETIALVMVVQLHDPLRRYEAVGGPVIVLVQTTRVEAEEEENERSKFRLASLHVGGMKVQTCQKKNACDTEKQRLTAMQWLIAYNMGKTVKKGKSLSSKRMDHLWSISSRIVADMWLKSIRNPNVKLT